MSTQATLMQALTGQLSFKEKRPGISQIVAPIFHEDGDMIDVFLDERSIEGNGTRLTDNGLTLMRLSYSFDIDTPNKRKILSRVLTENGISESAGELFLEVSPGNVTQRFLHFSQVIAKVTSLQYLKRQTISTLFHEQLADFVKDSLRKYSPQARFLPLKERPELEVDWAFMMPKPIFLFGVRDSSKARLSAISCLEFQRQNLPFRSLIVHEDFEDGLRKGDQRIITSAADKQFTSLDDFRENGLRFFAREAA